MFRLELHALWSHDYVVPLSRMLAQLLSCEQDEARALVQRIAEQETLILEAWTPTEATLLARDLLQFGVFVEVEQVGPVTDQALVHDAVVAMPKSMPNWYVLVDEQTGRPLHLVERETLASLRYEPLLVTEQVGEEMLRRGAIPIDRERMAELETVMDELRPLYEGWENDYMAGRIRMIKERRHLGESPWLDDEEENEDDEE